MTDFKDFKSSISSDDLAKLVDESINPFKKEDGAINLLTLRILALLCLRHQQS